MDLLPAPNSVLELANCKCKKNKCQTKSCTCFKNNLSCTEFCSCTDCENKDAPVEEEHFSDDGDLGDEGIDSDESEVESDD